MLLKLLKKDKIGKGKKSREAILGKRACPL